MSVSFYAIDSRQPPVTSRGFTYNEPFDIEDDINLTGTNMTLVLKFLGLYEPEYDVYAEFDLPTWNRAWILAWNQFDAKVEAEDVPEDRVDYIRRQLVRLRAFLVTAQDLGANFVYVY